MPIELTRIVEEDLKDLYNMRNDPEIMKWCRQFDTLHWQKHLRWYHEQYDDQTMSMYAIRNSSSKLRSAADVGLEKPVGVCGLTSIDHVNSRAEFSLYIGKDHQQQGYGEEALKALFNKGFNCFNLNLIWGESFEGNPAVSLFEKAGMKKDGVRRQFYYREGKYVDAYLYSITKKEFNKNG